MTRLSRNLEYLKPSETLAIAQAAQQRRAAGDDVIDLSAGEPDFDTPRVVSEAGIRAIQQGKTHYPPNAGLLELRAAAARHFSLLSGGRPVNADHLVVSTGAKQSLFNACFTLFGTGDKVLVPQPYWVSYPQMVRSPGPSRCSCRARRSGASRWGWKTWSGRGIRSPGA
jgi:aspartate aminotransferase